jgi:hypothetical protein
LLDNRERAARGAAGKRRAATERESRRSEYDDSGYPDPECPAPPPRLAGGGTEQTGGDHISGLTDALVGLGNLLV